MFDEDSAGFSGAIAGRLRLPRSFLLRAMAGLIVGLAGCSLAAAEAPLRKVLVIGIDGVRSDALRQADAPNLHALAEEGAVSWDAQCESRTFSAPNWTSIMGGVSIDKHLVRSNNYKDSRVGDWPDFLTYLKRHNPAWVTARLTTWDSFHNNQPTGADLNLYHPYQNKGDQVMTDRAVRLLSGTDSQAPGGPDVLFIYYADVDVAGHDARHAGFSPQSQSYMKAIATADRQVGRLLEAIEGRPGYPNERWLYVVTSDHGGGVDQRHSGNTAERRNIPFIVAGPAAAKGPIFPNARNVDVARTVLAYMDVPIQPEWQLDGHAVGLKPTAPPRAEYGRNLIFNGDAEYDRGFAQALDANYDQYCSGWRDDGPAMINIVTYDVDTAKYPSYLSPADSEKISGGRNFFNGGRAQVSRITQRIDLTALSAEIDAKKVDYTLSALLGGWESNQDCAMLIARFHDGGDHVTQTAVIGPVTAADRGNRTALLSRSSGGGITPGARSVEIELQCIRFVGETNDGYADNLSLVLSPRPEKKDPATTVPSPANVPPK